ncbi:MAG: radical SAM protein [Deltaproteobacteria bacterium]|nr:radical SAM protein [Deltaproteobacteria bacterium]
MCNHDYKSGLLLQWHLTERCNLRCHHCYQEGYRGEELPYRDLLRILEQYHELLTRYGEERGQPELRGHVTLTGGEPFARKDLLELCEELARHRHRHSWALLTNDTLIDEERAARLRALRPSFVQVSIEGSRKVHDEIRGKGSHAQSVGGIRHLLGHGIRVFLSFTAHSGNLGEFRKVARLGQRLGVDRVWADRLIPEGQGSVGGLRSPAPEETRRFLRSMRRTQELMRKSWLIFPPEIAMHRTLQFLEGGERPYRCTAGKSLLTVLPDGTLVPCRRMPLPVGNLRSRSMTELYYQSPLLRELREPERNAEGCEGCLHARVCGGGLRCLSQAAHGSPYHADPGCWRARPSRAGRPLRVVA